MEREINLNLAAMANRNTNATKYIRTTSRKRNRRKAESAAKTISTFSLLFLVILVTLFITWCYKASEKAYASSSDPVYVICDVIGQSETDTYTTIFVEMPDGSEHVYAIDDAPEGKIMEVTFCTTNQDDYTSYEVVAVR